MLGAGDIHCLAAMIAYYLEMWAPVSPICDWLWWGSEALPALSRCLTGEPCLGSNFPDVSHGAHVWPGSGCSSWDPVLTVLCITASHWDMGVRCRNVIRLLRVTKCVQCIVADWRVRVIFHFWKDKCSMSWYCSPVIWFSTHIVPQAVVPTATVTIHW